MRRLSPLLALNLLPIAVAAEPLVVVERDGEVVRVKAAVSVAVDPGIAWAVLSDRSRAANRGMTASTHRIQEDLGQHQEYAR